MRQRKRADWPITVYQYWVKLEHETWTSLPEGVKQEAEAMRLLWNELVDLFTQRLATPPALRSSQKAFLTETRSLAVSSFATWADKQFIMTQFHAALTRFFKAQSAPPRHKVGPPERLHFHHRFTDGGLPVERLFGRGQRLHLEPLAPESALPTLSPRQHKRDTRTTGSFQVGNDSLSFRTILHRPLPQPAYLKAATLVGQQTARSGYRCNATGGHPVPAQWRWSLHLTLEVPQYTAPLKSQTDLMAAINIDCQQVSETHIRIAVLTGTDGREEAIELPLPILQQWRYKRSLQRSADQLLSETKARLQDLRHSAQCPPPVRQALAHLEPMHAPGLWRLLDSLQTRDPEGAALDLVRHWADRSTRLLQEAHGLEQHYLRHRDWFYRNTAFHLCQRYQRLILTTEDSPTVMGEDARLAHGQPRAAYQQLVAPAHLIAFIQQAAQKTRTEVHIKSNQAYSVDLVQQRESFPDPVQRGKA